MGQANLFLGHATGVVTCCGPYQGPTRWELEYHGQSIPSVVLDALDISFWRYYGGCTLIYTSSLQKMKRVTDLIKHLKGREY